MIIHFDDETSEMNDEIHQNESKHRTKRRDKNEKETIFEENEY